jgi:putative restriction endonuclease
MPSKKALRINNYFAEILNAPVNDPRKSWGAISRNKKSIYLRVWTDGIKIIKGRPAYHLLTLTDVTKPYGKKERASHLDLIHNGSLGYAIVCTKKEKAGQLIAEIKSYDPTPILLAKPFKRGNALYAYANDLSPQSKQEGLPELIEDLTEIQNRRKDLKPTELKALINARLGQGQYRKDLIEKWEGKCPLTGCTIVEALRASHILPWKLSNDKQRLDSNNGVLLAASVDALFDRHIISFEDDGTLIWNEESEITQSFEALGIGVNRSIGSLNKKQANYMKQHRETYYLKTQESKSPKKMIDAA